MQKNVNTSAKTQNAAKKMYVPQVIESSMSGVIRPMMLDWRRKRISQPGKYQMLTGVYSADPWIGRDNAGCNQAHARTCYL